MKLPAHFPAAALQEAHKLLETVDGLQAVVIATIDGFDVAHVAHSNSVDPARIAAMTSSVGAIGDAVAREAQLGQVRTIVLNTEFGMALLQSVPRRDVPLVLNLIANEQGLMAQILYRAKETAKVLEEL